ncbi:MAG: ribosome recycling factor [Fimbriimonadaceae bacterium]
MSVDEIIHDAERKMKGAVEAMVHDFGTYRTGRASVAVLERVHVEYYGTETPISQVANISVPEPRQLLIQPYDKSMVAVIERAILKSDLGINPVNDGTGIRLNFPAMTEDRRKDMVKQVHARVEGARVSVRNIRRDAIEHVKALEKKKEITEDAVRAAEQKIQRVTDATIAEADKLGKEKETELMTV